MTKPSRITKYSTTLEKKIQVFYDKYVAGELTQEEADYAVLALKAAYHFDETQKQLMQCFVQSEDVEDSAKEHLLEDELAYDHWMHADEEVACL